LGQMRGRISLNRGHPLKIQPSSGRCSVHDNASSFAMRASGDRYKYAIAGSDRALKHFNRVCRGSVSSLQAFKSGAGKKDAMLLLLPC
jgi:hypothetical protein